MPRDSSRLMVLDRETGRVEHCVFRGVGSYLRAGDLLVLNDTRVIHARLYAKKTGTGGRVEILLLEQKGSLSWLALVGGSRVRTGTSLELLDKEGQASGVQAKIRRESAGAQRIVEFDRPSDQWLWELGHLPLPPYIRGYSGDPERYQTVFSRHEGSAAATTAGLHYTPDLLENLRAMGVSIGYVTLRIGLDTFKPITEQDISQHPIHTEWARLNTETARQVNETKLAGGRVVAVGTTVVRVLETAALRMVCGDSGPGERPCCAFEGPTDLYITPGFRFRAVDAMVTNFHLPRSTLLVLVAAFAGLHQVKDAYRIAIDHRYRFYSFGDAMLIL